MRSIFQVEYRPSLLAVREEILATLGHPVISALDSQAARSLNLTLASLGVIVIGHGAGRLERQELIDFFRRTAPGVPIIALLRKRDKRFDQVDYNCPADDPPEWGKDRHAGSSRNSIGVVRRGCRDR